MAVDLILVSHFCVFFFITFGLFILPIGYLKIISGRAIQNEGDPPVFDGFCNTRGNF